MTKEDFTGSLNCETPPPHWAPLHKAIWYAAKGNWQEAHNLAQEHEGQHRFDHLHAYLHRVEGDEWNAQYWYRRAGEKMYEGSFSNELKELVETLID